MNPALLLLVPAAILLKKKKKKNGSVETMLRQFDIRTLPSSEGCPTGYHICGTSKDAKGRLWIHCAPEGKPCPSKEDLRSVGIVPTQTEAPAKLDVRG